jgi:hypothetical protein
LHNKKNNYEWKESSSLYLMKNNKKIDTIGEFQIQNHRDSIKFRWCFEKILKIFSEYFEIIKL